MPPPRRHASTDNQSSPHDKHHHDDAHPAPVEEHFGKGFFISLAIIPAFLALYKYAKSADQDGSEPSKAWFTRLIHSYSQMQESWELRNALHAKMVDQAADDRTLFFNSKGSHGVELRFPEIMNRGSPRNVVAGWGSANLDKVIEKYERELREVEEEKVVKMARRRQDEEAARQERLAKKNEQRTR